ncbi:putative 30S ribosomal protein S17-like protein [Fusarium oxysporum f. sp. cubense]|uniref:Putative 30S ribosomal protein S17-like protein n=1 Tax=Fusarium oxysporum f. sp. cubense TaxID=61366 RepID=A0A559LWB8_FUSOC|nr:putative 30S ribosomal protein S17-like protein [Fusarium oxysporum f. sp. cubense]
MADIDEAIKYVKKAIGANPTNVENLKQLGNLLNDRYVSTGMLVDLDASILATKQAIDAIKNDDVELADCLNTLSYRLQDRFMVTEDNADLEEAIQISRKAVESTSSGNAKYLSNLAASLKTRFSVTGDLKDMEDGIVLAEKAVSVTASDDQELPKWLNNLGNHLSNRHLVTGSLRDLDEAINVSRRATATTSDTNMRALFLNNLSAKLDLKAEVTGNSNTYEEAIELARTALTLTPDGHPDQAKWLNNLAMHLMERFDRSWDLKDLQDAINAASRAADLTPNGSTKALYLDAVADGLNRKYEKMGLLTDLEEAIRMTEMALEMLPSHHSKRPQIISTLADLFSNRYLRKEMIQDLDRAIELSREAADAKSDNHPYKAIYLDRLAMQLNLRSSISWVDPHLWKDLDESIHLERKAIAITENNRPTWSFKNNLQAMLVIKYGLTKDETILDECTRLQREALDEVPEGHQYRAEMLTSLGYRLRDGAKNDLDLGKASECFLEALQNTNSPAISRVRAGSALLQCCPNKQKAYQAAQAIMGLLPELITRSHETSDKQHAAGSRAGMTCSAAAAALQADRPVFEVLQLLELGRGVLARYSEEMLLGPLQLGRLSTAQAEAYMHLRDELKVSSTAALSDMGNSFQNHVSGLNKRYDMATELEELIIEIRKLPGFEDLWTAPTEAETLEAAENGPIIVINISRARCDALLIEKHQTRSLALRNITNDLYQFARNGDFGSSKVLEWMWDNITKPVLDALGYSQPPEEGAWPHIWWMPTALLTLFPLHAAGYHQKESYETVLDRVVSSYASSIRAILRARQKDLPSSFSSTAVPQALLVGMQHTPESGSLPFANKEIDIVQKLCQSAGLETVRPRPRKEEVSEHLLDCKIFHFAGHGYTDENDPSNSHLRLEDWKGNPFRVADLQRMNLREHAPFLAYLSACGTVQMKRYNLVDESIHLISAYQLAGFRHVIGTLWKVSDQCCVDVAKTTYESMRGSGLSDEGVSWGLHRASRELRDKWVKEQKQGRSSLTRGGTFLRNRNGNVVTEKKYFKDEDGRDIVSVEEEPEVGERLQWTPYVHFGV